MVTFEEWLEEIRLFVVNKDEQHLYLGSPMEPRTTMVIINGSRITASIRAPPMTSSNLEARYFDQQPMQFSPVIQFLFLLLGQQFGSLLVNVNHNGSNEDILSAKFWDDDTSTSDQLVITPEILAYIAGEVDYLKEMDHFLQILSSTIRSERQEQLTNLVFADTPTSRTLVYYLFHFNDEFAISIIREYGRHGIHQKYICEWAKRYVGFQDKGYRRFAINYLHQFSQEYLNEINLTAEYNLQFQEFMNSSTRIRMQKTVKLLNSSLRADAFHYLEYLSADKYQLFLECRYIFSQLMSGRIQPEDLSPALVDLLQYAETAGSPSIAGVVLSFLNFRDKIDQESKEVSYSLLDGLYYYSGRRLNSLLRVWKKKKRNDFINEFLLSYFSTMPSWNLTSFDIEELPNWIGSHRILSRLKSNIQKLITREVFVMDIGFHSAFVANPIIGSIVRNYFSKVNLEDKYSLENNLALVGTYPGILDYPGRVPKIVSVSEVPHFQHSPIVFSMAKNAEFGLSSKLLYILMDQVFIEGKIALNQVIEYVGMLGRSHKDLLSMTFSTIIKLVDKRYDPDKPKVALNNIILQLIIPWIQITNSFAEDHVQQAIDTYKILFQEELEDFDLESSRSLDIETIVRSYRLSKGKIPKFVEGNIQFSFTKPVWDQLARHYLALGIERPLREEIGKSKLKEVPGYLIRDVLGQIAIVNQTLNYCERNGFRIPLENLIINNIYKRGWNVERGMERTLPALFGSSSPRLRSFLTAYMVVDQGEITLDLLQWARDVEIFALRERIVRELERYGTSDMWVVLAESYHRDLQSRSLNQLKEARMSPEERSGIVIKLLESSQAESRKLGRQWLTEQGVGKTDLSRLFYNEFEDNHLAILEYLTSHKSDLGSAQQMPMYDLCNRLIWQPRTNLSIIEMLSDLVLQLQDPDMKKKLQTSILTLARSQVGLKIKSALLVLSSLEVE